METMISTRVSISMAKHLNEVAKVSRRRQAAIVREALENYLEDWADEQVARRRLADSHDPVLCEKDFLASLNAKTGWGL